MEKIELLAPAGNLEKLKTAIDYGADAVYLGGQAFSLRAGAENFGESDLREGIRYARQRGKKCYLAVNIFARDADFEPLAAYLRTVRQYEPDAYIVSDPGVLSLVKEICPGAALHLSTQANTTNARAARFWVEQGVTRIILARELTINDICKLKREAGNAPELEAFVQGAMCVAYSGRCLLSNFMVGRNANRGDCAHACRWKYALVEEQRPGVYYPLEEDAQGTYILNAHDLCMIEHIPALIAAGLSALKIEGRMKSAFYTATTVSAYRKAIDAYYENREVYRVQPEWLQELKKASHRTFTTGFYFDGASETRDEDGPCTQTGMYSRAYTFVGVVVSYDEQRKIATVEQRNKMSAGDEIEVFGPHQDFFTQRITGLADESGNPLDTAPHPKQIVTMTMEKPVRKGFMLRARREACPAG